MATRKTTRREPARRRGRVTAARPDVSTIRYVESTALVAALLEHDTAVMRALPAGTARATSALTFAETARAIVRARATERLTEAQAQAATRALRTFQRRCFVVEVDARVLARVGRPFPVEPIRTLDAVHLATAELLGEPPQLVTIVTRDTRVRDNAKALGFAVA